MKNLLKNNPILNVFLIFLSIQVVSGCVVISANEPKTPIPEHDMDAFAKDHLSKDQKVYVKINMINNVNGKNETKPKDSEEDIKLLKDHLKKLNFAQFVDHEEDADDTVLFEENTHLNASKALFIISMATLNIIPFYGKYDDYSKIKITNKNGQTKEYSTKINGSIYSSIIVLPILPYFYFKKTERQKEFEDLIYKVGNDPIFQEKPTDSNEKSQPLSNS